MMRDPEDEKRIARLERLPELCRILRVYPFHVILKGKTILYFEISDRFEIFENVL